MNDRKKLSDILHQGADRESLARLWKTTAAAEERGPLPPGEYTFRTIAGELFTSKRGTPGYKLTLEVAEGDHEGRRGNGGRGRTMTSTPRPRYGFRVLGNATNRRRLVDAGAAFSAYAAGDPRAEIERASYLSAFVFGEDFRQHLQETGSTRDYAGPCWTPWLWFDIDREGDLEAALGDARRLAAGILQRYPALDEDDLLLFFSGSKGAHVGLPVTWGPAPSVTFHKAARRFCEALAAAAGVGIDTGVYDKVRLFRAPNSRHPKTGLHKRRLSFEQLLHLPADRVRQLAADPESFELPSDTAADDRAAADWMAALQAVERETEAKVQRRAAVADGTPRLNRATLDFITGGADQGDRHRLLFSAAANLAEFACPPALAHALLTEAALDAGLPPADVRRQIECGLAHAGKGAAHA